MSSTSTRARRTPSARRGLDPASSITYSFLLRTSSNGLGFESNCPHTSKSVRVPAGSISWSTSETLYGCAEGSHTLTARLYEYDSDENEEYLLETDSDSVRVREDLPTVTISRQSSPVEAGQQARFTIHVSPAPSSNLNVSVNVTQTGGVTSQTGRRTVSVSSGSTSGTLTIRTNSGTEGRITATVVNLTTYNVGSADDATIDVVIPTPTVTISRQSSPVVAGNNAGFTVNVSPAPSSDLDVAVNVTQRGGVTSQTGRHTVSVSSGSSSGTLTIRTNSGTEGSVTATVVNLSAYDVGSADDATIDVVPPTPTVTISRQSPSVVAGNNAGFTVKVSPAPSSDLNVAVNVTQRGGVTGQTGRHTVPISSGSTSGSFAVRTNSGTEGSVTATVVNLSAYDVGGEDDATIDVVPPTSTTPTLTITRMSESVRGGEQAFFKVTADPAPSANLMVDYSITQSGRVVSTTGNDTGTLGEGSDVFYIAPRTLTDCDGTVTVTLRDRSGYNVGDPSSANTRCTVDPTPQKPPPPPGFTASLVGQTSALLSWTLRDGIDRERIRYKVEGTGTWRVVDASTIIFNNEGASGDSTEYTSLVTGLERGSTYEFQVSSYGDDTVWAAEWSDWTASQTVTTPGEPTLTIEASGGVEVGQNARFTIIASTGPASQLTVNYNVSGVTSSTGNATTTLQSDQQRKSLSFTTDAAGSVTVTLNSGEGYNVGSPSSATVPVTRPKPPPPPRNAPTITVEPLRGISTITAGQFAGFTFRADRSYSGSLTVLLTVEQPDERIIESPPTMLLMQNNEREINIRWPTIAGRTGEVTMEVDAGTGYRVGSNNSATLTVVPVPKISIEAPTEVYEGDLLTFTLNLNPAPLGNLSIPIIVTENPIGILDPGSVTHIRDIRVSGGDTTHRLPLRTTENGDYDPQERSVSLQVQGGSGYVVMDTEPVKVRVLDDDAPPAPSGLRANGDIEQNRVTLRWNPVEGASSYNVRYVEEQCAGGICQPNPGSNWHTASASELTISTAGSLVEATLSGLTSRILYRVEAQTVAPNGMLSDWADAEHTLIYPTGRALSQANPPWPDVAGVPVHTYQPHGNFVYRFCDEPGRPLPVSIRDTMDEMLTWHEEVWWDRPGDIVTVTSSIVNACHAADYVPMGGGDRPHNQFFYMDADEMVNYCRKRNGDPPLGCWAWPHGTLNNPPGGQNIILLASEPWTTTGMHKDAGRSGCTMLQEVMAHEVGHAYGLLHAHEAADSIMRPMYAHARQICTPTKSDTVAIMADYQSR